MENIDIDEFIEEIEKMISSSCQWNKKECIESLYNCQKEALKRVLEKYFSNRRVYGVIQMPTGTGKTILAAALILAIWKYYTMNGKKHLLTLFLSPKIVIRKQAYEKFKNLVSYGSSYYIYVKEAKGTKEFCEALYEYFDPNYINKLKEKKQVLDKILEKLPQLKTFFSKHNRKRTCKNVTRGVVLLATPQLLHLLININKIKQYEKCIEIFKDNLDIMIMDEIHTFYTGEHIINTMNELIGSGKIPIIIGLTATPTQEAKNLLGGIIYNKFSQDAMREGILTPRLKIIRYKTFIHNFRPLISDPVKEKNEWSYAIKERAMKYAKIIVKELRKIRDETGLSRYPKTLVVATNTTEADLLAREIEKLVNNETTVLVAHYKVKDDDPHDVIEEFKKYSSGILVTVNMADIGFDDPELEVLVLARPITSAIAYVQLRGRVLRKPNSINNLKNLQKYAVIIDLVGKENLIYLERYRVKSVELGVYGKKSFDYAIKELRGTDTAPIAHADVEVKREPEVIIGESKGSDKIVEISKVNTREKSLEQLSKTLKDIYRIELDPKKKILFICRKVKHVSNCNGILLKQILSSISSANQEEIRAEINSFIRRFVQKYIHQDIKMIKKESGWNNSNEESFTNSFINMLTEKAFNEVIKLIQPKYLIKHEEKRVNKELDEISREDILSYLREVFRYGQAMFTYKNSQVELYLTKKNSQYYILVIIDNNVHKYIKVNKFKKIANTLLSFIKTYKKN